ncbi:ribokinase [Acetobacter sp.]|uniref:ribokinase n=1 Tax=Acetobacter sp. TaxID=440 RepID=UPI00258E83AA|nr:ribokinase [Acetobacter sp.]MCC6105311.1 ribokinase [Acetobacter sp.]
MSDTTPLILSFGSVNIDLTVRVDTFPKAGETLHASNYAVGLGGKGANQAAAAARLCQSLPTQVALAARVGSDHFGAFAQEALRAFGVETTPVYCDPDHPTGIALITVDRNGENCITVVGAANMAVNEVDVEKNADWLKRARILLLQLECPLASVAAAAAQTRQTGGLVILDPAPVPTEMLPASLWQNVDILTPNETETALLTGIQPETAEQAAQAAQILLSKGARAIVIKMGGRGTYWHDGTQEGFIPPFKVIPIDTVAAGDCFNAGLAVALSKDLPFPQAVRFASACGALATTRKGAADAAPTWEDVQTLLS